MDDDIRERYEQLTNMTPSAGGTTLLVPDVHENIDQLEKLLAQAGPHARRVFLGDWFDSFVRTEATTRRTLDWLQSNFKNETDEFLWGNHDLPYAYPGIRGLQCSGHNWQSSVLLAKHPEIWKRFQFSVVVGPYLASHAGFKKGTIATHADAAALGTNATNELDHGRMTPLAGAGAERGGPYSFGGCTWLDWRYEFEPTANIPQVVGHTRGLEPRWKNDSVCLDTDLKHYGVIGDDGLLTTHEVKE